MNTAYNPKDHEDAIAEKWQQAQVSRPETKNKISTGDEKKSKTGQSFTVPIPPPNVTGQLHLGHAMMLVVQDIMTRYHRMNGDGTLWVPGTDHAAIATESVVLKNLGVASREEFTREEFMEKCFDHTKKTHATISNQVEKMGASCDFTRERYTMDIGLSNAVWKIFKDLYDQDLIVRGHRMVNWSSGAQSVLADDELEYEDQKDTFCYIRCGRFVMGTVRSETKCANSPLVLHPDENYVVAKYTSPLSGGTEGGKIENNTPSSSPSQGENIEEFVFSEVLFDDTERRDKIFNNLPEGGTWEKVSVHPGKHFEGETFEAETYAGTREFFVLCDDEVIDINKGTGAMTISVNHAADDYLLAKKYPEQLKDYYFEKIGFDGKMTKLAGELEGDDVKKARKRAVKLMLAKGLIVGLEKDYVHNVPLCYRTGCVVEPMISPQWFVDVNKEFDWQENTGVVTQESSNVGAYPCGRPENSTKLFYARHGESEGNAKKVYQGILDFELTEKGKNDAAILAENVKDKNITTIVSSNLTRANHTANIVRDSLGLSTEVIIIPELHELNWGDDAGKPWDITGDQKSLEYYIQKNKTESITEIYARIRVAKKQIEELQNTTDGNILIVGHGQLSSFVFAENENITEENFLNYYLSTYKHFENGEVRELFPVIKKSLKSLTLEAISAHGGDINLIPDRFTKIYDHWIENLQDWCISRQIWWGHQIPIWYDEEGTQHAAHEQSVIFARHGESEDNLLHKIGGDSSLTEKGRGQAKELAEKLIAEGRKISTVYHSSLKRSKETAEIVASTLKTGEDFGAVKIEEFPEFHEIEAGSLEGQEYGHPDYKHTMYRMFAENTGETPAEIEARAKAVWDNISKLNPEDGTKLFIGHRTFLSQVMGVKDGCTKENLPAYRDRWSMKPCETREVTWMMKPEGAENLRQDEDTLDTWFSSALWPFSTLGWPDKTPDFEQFFPTSVLETGHDILFFWVARMIMFSRFSTGKSPFTDVYLHGLVADQHGKKMSKSKGNGIDPLDMIEKFGTDAVRMSLVVGTTPGNQVNLGEKKIEGYRNFGNKLWNISRYILSMEKAGASIHDAQCTEKGNDTSTPLHVESLPEQWILSKLQTLITEVSEGIEAHQYGEVGQKLYDFTWNDLADWALESAKAVESNTIDQTLRTVLTELLKLLHPYMPFITEAIWEEMNASLPEKASLVGLKNTSEIESPQPPLSRGSENLLALTDFPTSNEALQNKDAEEQFAILQNVIGKIRSLRSASKVDPVKKITAVFKTQDSSFLQENEAIIKLLARLENLEYGEKPAEECVSDITDGVEIFLPLSGMLDMEKEKERRAKELEDARKMLANLEGRMANKKYMDNAPENLVAQTKAQYEEVKEKIRVLEG